MVNETKKTKRNIPMHPHSHPHPQHYTCCICGKEFDDYGNNPQPISQKIGDRCCNACDMIVLAHRIDRSLKGLNPRH